MPEKIHHSDTIDVNVSHLISSDLISSDLISSQVNLLITNYQILSGLPQRVNISFPPFVSEVLRAMTTLINIECVN
jgi:hypothetical protein